MESWHTFSVAGMLVHFIYQYLWIISNQTGVLNLASKDFKYSIGSSLITTVQGLIISVWYVIRYFILQLFQKFKPY